MADSFNHIGFNKPYISGKEIDYILEAVKNKKISGNGYFTKKCNQYFENRYHFKKCLLTTSCTDALEMASLLLDIEPGDEIIMPSYTFVSTANAFILRNAKIIFADSQDTSPNLDPDQIEPLVSPRTKAIVVVHYAGIACDMQKIISLAKKYNLLVIEDAAQAIDSFYKDQPLGSIGDLGTFSFHETKNIIAGEGGMLSINNEKFIDRSEIMLEKGTNRSAFFRGEVDKYNWVDVGSSFLPSEITAAFLYAQLENLDDIQQKRMKIWQYYYNHLRGLEEQGIIKLPYIPSYATNNAHMFYLVCENNQTRTELIDFLKGEGVQAVFHYLSLHKSPFYKDKHDGRELPNADKYTECLLRLPFYYEIKQEQLQRTVQAVSKFYDL